MRVCVVGLGSIGTRHIRNMYSMYGRELQIDLLRSGKGNAVPKEIGEIINKEYFSFEELPEDYDVIFIANPTRLHYETLISSERHAKNFFIEKPVFETGNENVNVFKNEKDKIFYVACPLRYTNVIQYLKSSIDFSEVFSIRCISSSYLPEWRPTQDYRETYSAHKELGGGVAIDLIHEWDYLCYLLGMPEEVLSIQGKYSDLEINSEDVAVYIGRYPKLLVEVHLDYFGRIPIRKIEIFCKNDTIEADLIRQKIEFKRTGRVLDLSESRDSYQKKELQHFFDIIAGKKQNDNDIEQACKVLKIARGEY